MKRYNIFIIIVMTSASIAVAQQNTFLKPQVIASGGSSGTGGNYYMSYTIGQPVAYKGTGGTTMLTQGFQQPGVCLPYQNEEICFISVDTLYQRNLITWKKTYYKGTQGYVVYKEIFSNVYDSIGYVDFSQPAVFMDLISNPEVNSCRYKIAVEDTCGNRSVLSPFHQTMMLQVSQGAIPSTFILNWTPYIDESGTYIPSEYQIFRGTSASNMTLLTTVPGTQNAFNDINVTNTYFYMIKIDKGESCDSSLNLASSFSNIKENIPVYNPELYFEKINIFPNPMVSEAFISMPGIFIEKTKTYIEIIDVAGKIVRKSLLKNEFIKQAQNKIEIIIDRGDLKSGIYFVEVHGEKVYRGKMVVE